MDRRRFLSFLGSGVAASAVWPHRKIFDMGRIWVPMGRIWTPDWRPIEPVRLFDDVPDMDELNRLTYALLAGSPLTDTIFTPSPTFQALAERKGWAVPDLAASLVQGVESRTRSEYWEPKR